MHIRREISFGLAVFSLIGGAPIASHAQAVKEYGDENLLGTGTYSSDPKAGATLYGLSAGVITDAANTYKHSFPPAPGAGEFAGTDQIYVGSTQTAQIDGYSAYSGRLNGPQVLSLDYSSLLPAGQQVQTLTLGIATDDFQFPVNGQPFAATLNGVASPDLTNKLNSLLETGPATHFFTFGVDPSLLTGSKVLTLSIDEGGNGGDGWAVDFLTVGITSAPVPEASTTASFGFLLALGLGGLMIAGKRRKMNEKASV